MADTRMNPKDFLDMTFNTYTRLLYKDFDKLSRTKTLKSYFFLHNYKFGGKKRDLILFIDEKDFLKDKGSWKAVIEAARKNIAGTEKMAYGECRVVEVPDRDGDGDDDITLAIKTANGLSRDKLVTLMNKGFEGNPDILAVELKEFEDAKDTQTIINKRKVATATAKKTGMLNLAEIIDYHNENTDAGLGDMVSAIQKLFTVGRTDATILEELQKKAKAFKKGLKQAKANDTYLTKTFIPLASGIIDQVNSEDELLGKIIAEVNKWLFSAKTGLKDHFAKLEKPLENFLDGLWKLNQCYARLEVSVERYVDLKNKKLEPSVIKQVIVNMFQGGPIMLNDIELTDTIKDVKGMIEDKTGVPAYEQSLQPKGGGVLPDTGLVQHHLTNGMELKCNLRLDGGYGERDALRRIILQNVKRGNVRNDMLDTKGDSASSRSWVRKITSTKKMGDEYKNLGNHLLANNYFTTFNDWVDWTKSNRVKFNSLIALAARAGNCAEFAYIIMQDLIENTNGQYVYRLSMRGQIPRKKLPLLKGVNKQKRRYDHVLCLTSPKSVTNPADFDKKTTMVIDAWDSNSVCTYGDFLKGLNPYGIPLDFDNLNISTGPIQSNGGALKNNDLEDEIVSYIRGKHEEAKKGIEFKIKSYDYLLDIKANKEWLFGEPKHPVDEHKKLHDYVDLKKLLGDLATDDMETYANTLYELNDDLGWQYFEESEEHRTLLFSHPISAIWIAEKLETANDLAFKKYTEVMSTKEFSDFVLSSTKALNLASSREPAKTRFFRKLNNKSKNFDIPHVLGSMTANQLDSYLADHGDYLEKYGSKFTSSQFLTYFTNTEIENQQNMFNSKKLRQALYKHLIDEGGTALAFEALGDFPNEQLTAFFKSSKDARKFLLGEPTILDRLKELDLVVTTDMNDSQYVRYWLADTSMHGNQKDTDKTKVYKSMAAQANEAQMLKFFGYWSQKDLKKGFVASSAKARKKIVEMPTILDQIAFLPEKDFAEACLLFSDKQIEQACLKSKKWRFMMFNTEVEALRAKSYLVLKKVFKSMFSGVSEPNDVNINHEGFKNWFRLADVAVLDKFFWTLSNSEKEKWQANDVFCKLLPLSKSYYWN